jgi:hypothetical protein
VTHEIIAELKAAKKRLAELERNPHPKGEAAPTLPGK